MTASIILIVAITVMVGVYVSWRAGRLDRLHARADTARAVLDAALVRRSSVAIELAACGLLDPATSILIGQAAHDARSAGGPSELAESDLTRALRAALGQPGFAEALAARGNGDELLAELEAAAHQVYLARMFYNDAVAATQIARQRYLVRVLRLAGGAATPEFFEIDDSLALAGEPPPAAGDLPRLTGGVPPAGAA